MMSAPLIQEKEGPMLEDFQVIKNESKWKTYLIFGVVVALGLSVFYMSVWVDGKVPNENSVSELKSIQGAVMESGKAIFSGEEPTISGGFTMNGDVGVLVGSRRYQEEGYKVVIRLAQGQLVTFRGMEGSEAQKLSYDFKTGDSVIVSYVERKVNNPLEHKTWSEVRGIRKKVLGDSLSAARQK